MTVVAFRGASFVGNGVSCNAAQNSGILPSCDSATAGLLAPPMPWFLGSAMTGRCTEHDSWRNVGKMRQSSTPKPGITYWMAFSNVGRRMKRGDRVDVLIGHFRAGRLVVQ